jgi:glycosyltransferase involved in cell wall biosynthesis
MNWRSIASHRVLFKRSLAEAHAICTVSDATAKKLRDLLGHETTAVVKPSVSDHFKPKWQEEVSARLQSYGVHRPYLLALATWEPRKNLSVLVETFTRMKGDGSLSNHSLVLVGARGWRDERLASVVRNSARSGVIALGYVPDDDLPTLYSGCDVFVFPSIYEGFGIPVLEARACGARVVATDIPEIREAGGDSTTYVMPTSEGIRSGIMRVLSQQQTERTGTMCRHTWEEGAATLARLLIG